MSRRGKEPRVLVVDDEVDICANMADILSDLGFRVDTASDSQTALELVRREPYEVALLDLKMPGMDGLELYRRIRRERAGIIVILVTAHANTPRAEEALASGAWKVVAKPVNLPRLVEMLDEAIGQPLVLIVDDDQELCSNLWDVLRERDFRVVVAHDEKSALRLFRENRFQLALLDLRLGSGNSLNFFRQVQAISEQTRTILITGHRKETERLVEQFLDEGAHGVCYKPFDVPRLLELIRAQLESEPR
jgi:two-component system response regulator HydG